MANASFSYTKNSRVQTAALPPINIAPAGSVSINLRDYQMHRLIPLDVAIGNIKLEYNAGHDAVLADLASVDQSGSFVSPVPLTCAGNHSTHMVFWRTDGAWESMVTLQNVAAASNDLEAKITWQGGEYVVRKTIAPGDTAMVSVNEIQTSQQPDAQGNVIPQNVTLGGINILSRNQDHGLVINAMLMNPVTRTCSECSGQPYVTSNCLSDQSLPGCGFTDHPVGDVFSLYMNVFFSDQSFSPNDVATSGSTNMSEATDISGDQVSVVGAGQTLISGTTATDPTHLFFTNSNCDLGPLTANAPLQVKPHIGSISPTVGCPGSSVNVTVDGSGFVSNSFMTETTNKISIIITNRVSSSQVIASFSISINAAAGDYQVYITSNNQNSNTATFTVRVPDHLVVVSDTGNSAGVSGCPIGIPIGRAITLRVVDIPGNSCGAVPMQELFSNLTCNTCRTDCQRPNPDTCFNTASDGTFTDNLSVNCNTVNGSCGYNLTDKWQYCPTGGSPKTLATLNDIVHADQVTVNNNTAGFSTDTPIRP